MAANDRVVVIGASGFGRECLDVLEAMIGVGAKIDIIGVIDDSPSEINLKRLKERDVEYLGAIAEWLAHQTNERYVLGIGNPAVRRSLVAVFDDAGVSAIQAVHPHSTLGARTELTDGVVVCAGAAISTNVAIGRHVHINPNATIGHDADLRDFVSINPAAVISGEVVVERETLIGAGATVLQGLTVGERTIVGAGSVVTRNIPEGMLVKGIPGRWTSEAENA